MEPQNLPRDILEFLRREDKWYLAGGERVLWSPPFPVWLDVPGLFDGASYYNYTMEPIFTWSVMGVDGIEIPLRAEDRAWTPAAMERHFSANNGIIAVTEQNACLPGDTLASTLTIENLSTSEQILDLVCWTVQANGTEQHHKLISDIAVDSNSISFATALAPEQRVPIDIACRFHLDRPAKSFAIQLSEGTQLQPHWRLTPFYDRWDGQLGNAINTSGIRETGLIYMALHVRITLPPKGSETISAGFQMSPGEADAQQPEPSNLAIAGSIDNWRNVFAKVPHFQCSDEYLTRYYWYRWYGLRAMELTSGEGNYSHPAICEGPGYFRAPITYSAQCHMRETRWMQTPHIAQGSLMNFITNQDERGRFLGYLDVNTRREETFYHADWGTVVRELHAAHPDGDYLQQAYDGLVRYMNYFDDERDSENSGLYDIENHYETGQEYMNRYMAVSPRADADNWGDQFRLKGVDVAVYMYELQKALAWMAEQLNRPADEVAQWSAGAKRTGDAILTRMWDPEQELFFDIDPRTNQRTGVKAATCFYPYMTDLVDQQHLPGLKAHLLNPNEFWTPWPVPATAVDDPTFSAAPLWKDMRMSCPWNGRVWPMTNSHIAEALASAAIRLEADLRPVASEFIHKFVTMMFFDGDPKRPNCFEHYHPYNGRPSVYRGVDDYQHSWIVDLLLKYTAGVRPAHGKIIVDPFPFGLEWLKATNIVIAGHTLEVTIRGDSFTATMDGIAQQSRIGAPVEFAI